MSIMCVHGYMLGCPHCLKVKEDAEKARVENLNAEITQAIGDTVKRDGVTVHEGDLYTEFVLGATIWRVRQEDFIELYQAMHRTRMRMINKQYGRT